ncbi:hypothetical protein LFL96_27445 [Paraburkholderia sp. D15]|uniref:hypothetical protein n=1 Tax=Paraburkholderia sp. D15 TaxID=2880218 RepID=UPI00247A49E0|nr:hypothetical protein [Paraburkholderia sp. D15]WGS51944.1 hypothetical protein LFL96_27445 [Paraburkholderia sp. D15]
MPEVRFGMELEVFVDAWRPKVREFGSVQATEAVEHETLQFWTKVRFFGRLLRSSIALR